MLPGTVLFDMVIASFEIGCFRSFVAAVEVRFETLFIKLFGLLEFGT